MSLKCVEIFHIAATSQGKKINIYTDRQKFEQVIVQKQINLSARVKDDIVLTHHKEAHLTTVIIRDLSKHLPEKLKITPETSKAAESLEKWNKSSWKSSPWCACSTHLFSLKTPEK